MHRARLAFFGLLMVGVCLPAGCGSKTPTKTSIKGRVLYHGEPLPGGMIVFAPDVERGNDGPLAKSAIAADGTFTLAPETAAGWYRIAIAPLPSDSAGVPTVSQPYPGPPARYRNPQLSGLLGEIKPGTENSFEFQLDD